MTRKKYFPGLFTGRGNSVLSCQPFLISFVAINSFQLQDKAFEFGKNLALAHQLKEDLQTLHVQKSHVVPYSAPVILSSGRKEVKTLLNQIFVEKGIEELDHLYQQLTTEVANGESIQQIKELCLFYASRALESLSLFPNSEAKQALVNITNSCTIQEL